MATNLEVLDPEHEVELERYCDLVADECAECAVLWVDAPDELAQHYPREDHLTAVEVERFAVAPCASARPATPPQHPAIDATTQRNRARRMRSDLSAHTA